MRLRIAPQALSDLQNIKNYIVKELKSPAAAEKILRKIIADYNQLEKLPFLGLDLTAKIGVPVNYRFLVSGNYLIFYQTEKQYVSIIRVIYAKRDYKKLLGL